MKVYNTHFTTTIGEVILKINGKNYSVFVAHVLANGNILDTLQGYSYEILSTNIKQRCERWKQRTANTNKATMEKVG